MAKNSNSHTVTVDQAQAIIREPKTTIREMEWIPKRTISNPQWIEFYSACKIGSEVREDVMFRAQYRARRVLVDGLAEIETSEIFNAAIVVGPCRIIALDSEDTPHKNRTGIGLPFYKQTIKSRTHLHIWTAEGYGYVEPIEPPLNDVESLIAAFLPLANLTLVGGFRHPLKGQQQELL